MLFEDLLSAYEISLDMVKRLIRSDEYCKGYKEGLFRMFQTLKQECEDIQEVTSLKDPTEEEMKLYSRENEELFKVIRYRGYIIPVYMDDYGQSLYARIREEEFSGGTYNLYCGEDFCYILDTFIKND